MFLVGGYIWRNPREHRENMQTPHRKALLTRLPTWAVGTEDMGWGTPSPSPSPAPTAALAGIKPRTF